MSEQQIDQGLEALLDYLRRTRGFDFSAYKRPSLTRRIQKRVGMVGSGDFAEYMDYLEVHPDEFMELFNTILINVTYFFRDDLPWEYIKNDIIPRILAGKRDTEPVRVWSAGCASGEEAYSVAMTLAEALGEEQYRDRVKIYATDADEGALAEARAGVFSPSKVEAVPPDLLEKYFDKNDSGYVFRKEPRRNVIFGRHDLIQDAPISRVDLLICRNTLMYFNAEAQSKILLRFHFALNDSGFLFLGRSEMLLTRSSLFVPVDLKQRVFKKVSRSNARERLAIFGQGGDDEDAAPTGNTVRIREASFDVGPLAQITVDANGFLILANQQARALLGVNPRDEGRLLQDLEISYRPVEVRSLIEQACAERRLVSRKNVKWAAGNADARFLDIDVMPLVTAAGALIGATATYTDVTRIVRLEEDLQRTRDELETAYEELQSTVEELETTNEELQSTNEELETLNEELQSTNEELETMNEEQQSTNAELESMNHELQTRTNDISQLNLFLESILSSVRVGVVVLNPDMRVQVWNRKAEDFWGLRADEVLGKHFLTLDITLELEQLKEPIKEILSGEHEFSDSVQSTLNRRGKPLECRITMVQRNDDGEGIQGVVLLIEEVDNGNPARRNGE